MQLNRELMTAICVCAPSEKLSKIDKIHREIFGILIQMLLLYGYGTSIIFIWKYLKSDLPNALYAIFQVAGEFGAWYTVFITYLHSGSVLIVFNKLKDIRENGKSQQKSAKYNLKSNRKRKCSLLNNSFIWFFMVSLKVIDYDKSYAKHFAGVDSLCTKITKLTVQVFVAIYIVLSIVQGILNVLYCYHRNDGFDGIDPQCLYTPYRFV